MTSTPLFVPSSSSFPFGVLAFRSRFLPTIQQKLTNSSKTYHHTHRRPRNARFYASSSDQHKDATSNSDSSMNWQQELRLLLDPTMSLSVKQVLAQDFAKRLPDVFKSPCARGVEDVVRQVAEDIIPDLVSNGPRYVSRVVEKTASAATAPSNTSSSFKPPSVGIDDVSREFRNVFNRTPEGLFTPDFKVLVPSSKNGYEIRKYPTIMIAETDMKPESSPQAENITEVESATAMGQSFNTLAGYLFGKNQSQTEMKMTTPVMLSKGAEDESMSFIIGEYKDLDDVPKTLDESVKLREEPGAIYAVIEFSGFVTVGEAKRQREKLLNVLEKDGVKVSEHRKDNYKCMIYNGPSTLPYLRRNELMIEVEFNESEGEQKQETETEKDN